MITVQENVFHIVANGMSYAFRVLPQHGCAQNIYWGAEIATQDVQQLLVPEFNSSFDEDTNAERNEYSVWGGHSFEVPCLKAVTGKNRAQFMAYQTYSIDKEEDREKLTLVFANEAFTLELIYTVFPQGILERHSRITAKAEVQLTSAMSASLSLPPFTQADIRYTVGKWAAEAKIVTSVLNTGILTLQAKRGIPGPHFNPAVAFCAPQTTETNGDIWFSALAYSGNWAMHIEKTEFGNTHLVAGCNDFDFSQTLAPGESFTTPELYCGFTTQGFGAMSRLMHTFVRHHIMPKRGLRRVLYNSWEATAFAVRADEQMKLAEKAAEIGCELFVIDDGWFGDRHSDKAGLGDWTVNQSKFPQGLSALVNYVNNLGMDFGIWVEPEAVNPDSDLYRAHPDWAYHLDNAQPILARNQLSLNITLPQVQAYLRECLSALLSKNNISYLKWDMNRPLTDMQPELWSKHVQALYALWGWLRDAFPQVELETCSGGGGRVELGSLRYAHQSWPSDNTDAYDRLYIQEGFTQFYPPNAMMCWVTNPGTNRAPRSLDFRFHSAMCGGLGIGANIASFTQEELNACKHWIAQYKKWRPIILNGTLYRLRSPRESAVSAVQYLSQDEKECVVFMFLHSQCFGQLHPNIRLQGMENNTVYLVNGKQYTGKTLMNAGIPVTLTGDFQSQAVYITMAPNM